MRLTTLATAVTFVLATATASLSALAAPAAVVEGVQMPAWVERGGVKQPLAAGMELQESDKLSTGGQSRVLLRLAEGSLVKLGENAQMSFEKLEQRTDNKSTFVRGLMDVARGAFRFTTDVKSKIASRREIDIRLATVTAGVRGTDLWGKSAAEHVGQRPINSIRRTPSPPMISAISMSVALVKLPSRFGWWRNCALAAIRRA